MERLWVVALDTARLRPRLKRAAAQAAQRALEPAARAVGVELVDACLIPFGVRAIVAARDRASVRAYLRRFVALAADSSSSWATWRAGARLTPIPPASLDAWRAFVRRCRLAFEEEMMGRSVAEPRSKARAGVRYIRAVDAVVDGLLGADDCTARVHRYVADHDAPADDSIAFGRLCEVIFTQGIGIAVVIGKRDELRAAFHGFDPAGVAGFDDADVRRLLGSPIIRNEAKIRACIENARRWQAAAASEGSYLARIARIAADDDAANGWPALVAALAADFVRIAEPAARQTLKRWGFFTAAPHPGSRRVIERLGFADHDAPPAAYQVAIGAIANALGRDPYAVEAMLSLFAALGPCKPMPQCGHCALAERCPTGSKVPEARGQGLGAPMASASAAGLPR